MNFQKLLHFKQSNKNLHISLFNVFFFSQYQHLPDPPPPTLARISICKPPSSGRWRHILTAHNEKGSLSLLLKRTTLQPFHFQEYFDETKASLAKTSDQLIESAHQETHRALVRGGYIVKDVKSPQHGEKLLRGILHMNSYTAINMGLVFLDSTQMMAYMY